MINHHHRDPSIFHVIYELVRRELFTRSEFKFGANSAARKQSRLLLIPALWGQRKEEKTRKSMTLQQHHWPTGIICIIIPFLFSLSRINCLSFSSPQQQQQTKVLATPFRSDDVSSSSSSFATPKPIQLSNTTITKGSKTWLLSLQWTSDDDPLHFSKIVRDTWRWKDTVLGDGRDFFVPKPKTLKALQSFLMRQVSSGTATNSAVLERGAGSGTQATEIEECVVLSNCARFEILVVSNEDPTQLISSKIVSQLDSFNNRPPIKILLPLDLPNAIDLNASPHNLSCTSNDKQQQSLSLDSRVEELSRHWTLISGIGNVTEHLCCVASGMAERPSRPNRSVVFQPFSSRDAHILLQLKRTMEIALDNSRVNKKNKSNSKNDWSTTTSRLPTIIRFALQAGKTARNPDKVPELLELRQYGTGNSKFSPAPPIDLSKKVAEVAFRKAINPVVDECVAHFIAMDQSACIRAMRNMAESVAIDEEELQWVRKCLHSPTMDLRNGKTVDTQNFLDDLSRQLASRRKNLVR